MNNIAGETSVSNCKYGNRFAEISSTHLNKINVFDLCRLVSHVKCAMNAWSLYDSNEKRKQQQTHSNKQKHCTAQKKCIQINTTCTSAFTCMLCMRDGFEIIFYIIIRSTIVLVQLNNARAMSNSNHTDLMVYKSVQVIRCHKMRVHWKYFISIAKQKKKKQHQQHKIVEERNE